MAEDRFGEYAKVHRNVRGLAGAGTRRVMRQQRQLSTTEIADLEMISDLTGPPYREFLGAERE